MGTKLGKSKTEILAKKQILETTRQQLKSEFFGLDDIIDELINIVSSWYIFPYIQEKPLVVNLWGLTGTGKTSLVNQMIELLNFGNKHYKFDMSREKKSRDAVIELIDSLNESNINSPFVISLDEFQHARTLNEFSTELRDSNTGMIWNLLDTGKVEVTPDDFYVDELTSLINFYRKVLKIGITVRDGMVVKKAKMFIRKCGQEDINHNKIYYCDFIDDETGEVTSIKSVDFVSNKDIEILYETSKHKFSFLSKLQDKLKVMNGPETIEFIKELLTDYMRPKITDASKSLIFVIGNLDEAYSMGANYTPDISADEFHEQTKKINITQIKDALKKRFRHEQIARLGNTHIIYPAFNKAAFNSLIEKQLEQITSRIKDNFDLNVIFDASIKQLIYSEGVFPTQGARPIFTTIQQIISTRLSKLASEILLNNLSPDKIIFSYKQGFVHIKYYSGKHLEHSFNEKQLLNLEKLRESKKDDMQAITAVHESGHAILTALLLNTIPETIISSAMDKGVSGFVFSKIKWNYISKNEVQARIAAYFGGYIAEEIVFGKDRVTMGSEQDISNATGIVTTALKSNGMGDRLASFKVEHDKNNYAVFDVDNEINEEALKWLKSGRDLAEKTLKANKVLLLNMSNYLSDHRVIHKKQIKQMVLAHAQNFSEDQLVENGDRLFYRKCLKDSIKEIHFPAEKTEQNTLEFSLNKNESTVV